MSTVQSLNWLPELNWGNALSVIGIATPLVWAGYRSYVQLRDLRCSYFPHVLHLHLFSIVPSRRYSNKYTCHYSSLLKDELSNIIYNYHGQRVLQRYWRKCSKDDPLIHIQIKAQHHFILNSIITKLNEKFAPLWLYRDQPLTMDRTKTNYDAINGNMYILALVNTDVIDMNVRTDYGDANVHQLIRGILIKNETIRYLNEEYDVSMMSKAEWEDKLDVDYIRECDGDDFVIHCLRGWNVVKKILEQYDKQQKTMDGQLKWGQPLAQVELPSMRIDDKQLKIYAPPVFSSYKAYKENIPSQLTGYDSKEELLK